MLRPVPNAFFMTPSPDYIELALRAKYRMYCRRVHSTGARRVPCACPEPRSGREIARCEDLRSPSRPWPLSPCRSLWIAPRPSAPSRSFQARTASESEAGQVEPFHKCPHRPCSVRRRDQRLEILGSKLDLMGQKAPRGGNVGPSRPSPCAGRIGVVRRRREAIRRWHNSQACRYGRGDPR